MISKEIRKILRNENLTFEESKEISKKILEKKVCEKQIKELLISLKEKGETYNEVAGFAKTLKSNSIKYDVSDKKVYDIVGTGGDKLNTFNISTTCAFVLSSMGLNIAKHGNRSVSSKCGSIDVLDELGIDVNVDKKTIEKQIDEIGLSFIFAQNVHPLMKNVARVRKELASASIFNIVGPISNPVNLYGQVVGVYRKELLTIVNESLIKLGVKNSAVIYGYGGMDEASLEGDNIVIFNRNSKREETILNCKNYGMKKRLNSELVGDDKITNAKILMSVLRGEESAYMDVVVFNCAIALYAFEIVETIEGGIKMARKAIKEKKAILKLEELVAKSV